VRRLISYLPLSADDEFLELVSAQRDVLLGLVLVRQPLVANALGGSQPLPANIWSRLKKPPEN
jgi:hypothetical protein